MATQAEIKTAVQALKAKLLDDPDKAKIEPGAVCEIKHGLSGECDTAGFKFHVDVNNALGGNNSGPSPGAYGRSAVAACIAIGCAMEFAERELPIDGIRVAVTTKMDSRGGLGLDDVAPGFKSLQYDIDVQSEADPTSLREAVNFAASKSTMLQSCVRPIPSEGTVRINAGNGIAVRMKR